MGFDRPNGAQDRRPIVVRDAIAARQWETHLAAERLASGAGVWLSPHVIGYRTWTQQLWVEQGHGAPAPLSPLQSEALWRRLIADSPEGATLISDRGAAEWAAEAWTLTHGWGLDLETLRSHATGPDTRAFLGWGRAYRAILTERLWVDPAEVDARLAEGTVTVPAVALADLGELSPARAALLARLQTRGCHVDRWALPETGRTTHRCRLPDEASELRGAARWALGRLTRGSAQRIALVVPRLDRRAAEVARLFGELPARQTDAWPLWQSAGTLDADALVGAALTSIELMSPKATFKTFSRWLRSPLIGAADPATRSARARLELQLRRQLRSQLPFHSAYREAGLALWLQEEAPEIASELAAASAAMADWTPATPGRWSRRWQRALLSLGWPRPGWSEEDPSLRSWQVAMDEFSKLTPVLGLIDAGQALEELERVVRRRPTAQPLPSRGIHVFAHPDSVGPGYDAAWVTGLTDAQWPEPVRPNPLLPRALQRRLSMPWSTPDDARRRSAASLARLMAGVTEVVLSWPQRVYDYEAEPSPALASLPDLPMNETVELLEGSPADSSRRRLARETLADAAPALETETLRGGTGLLRAQARCPLRAYCEYRLGAEPITTVARGLSDRQRGIATHRALELLLRHRPSQAELLAEGRAGIGAAVERALEETFGGTRRHLRALFALERTRLAHILASVLDCDARRRPFTVVAVEDRRNVRLGRWTIRTRVDRLDRLAEGGIAVIDYKTGAQASPADWLHERLRDAQVPLYAVTAEAPVAAALIAKLSGRAASYVGFWPDEEFPGRTRRLPAGRAWEQQIALWRAQIVQLIEEFAAGDTRLLPTDLDDARAAYAPLSRVAEQLALHHGALAPW